jgi:hypothetical protein
MRGVNQLGNGSLLVSQFSRLDRNWLITLPYKHWGRADIVLTTDGMKRLDGIGIELFKYELIE